MDQDIRAAVPTNKRAPDITRAEPGEHFFQMTSLDKVLGGPDYSSALGACVTGDRMMVALMRMPTGTGSEPHSHPNEQWIFVLEGTLEAEVAGELKHATAGTVIYIPANVVHHATVRGDRDVVFFTVKDTSHGLAGTKV